MTSVQPNLKIVGGIVANSYSWPAQVALTQSYQGVYNGRKVACSSMCGGTLINRFTVMSAAHCIPDSEINCYYMDNQIKVTVPLIFNQYYPNLASMFDVYLGVQDISFLQSGNKPSYPGVHATVQKVVKVEN
jgi:hypothetical protein